MILGKKIKELRLSCSLTQEELADRCELTKGYISQLENDLTSPSIATLIDILLALGTDLKEFFASDDSEEKITFNKNEFIEKRANQLKSRGLNDENLIASLIEKEVKLEKENIYEKYY